MKVFGHQTATRSPTKADLYWIAGFLEGEGSFVTCQRKGQYRENSSTFTVSATQKEIEPLLALQMFLGGSIDRVEDTRTIIRGSEYYCTYYV